VSEEAGPSRRGMRARTGSARGSVEWIDVGGCALQVAGSPQQGAVVPQHLLEVDAAMLRPPPPATPRVFPPVAQALDVWPLRAWGAQRGKDPARGKEAAVQGQHRQAQGSIERRGGWVS
jgi:hypothetical protein